MKRMLMSIAAVALATGVVFIVGARLFAPPGRVYTVAQLRAGMGRQPRLWLGRTVLVRALAFPLGSHCPTSNPWCTNVVLADHEPTIDSVPTLVAMAAQPNPYTSLLRRVPFVDRLIPDPQQVDWGHLATYRIQLSAQPFVPCIPPCMNAQLEGMVR